MKQSFLFLVLFCLFGLNSLIAQKTNELKADSFALIGISLMDEGSLDSAILYLNLAKEIYPDKLTYDYEIGLALYMKKDYKSALKLYKKLVKKKGSTALHFKMLGNTYSVMGEREKAIKTYKEGLEKYPNAGNLYLELGIVEVYADNYSEAVSYWEKGIEVDPEHPSNYYWAAKIYASSTEKIWALLYGELFMNLEPTTARSEEISALLYETYGTIYEVQSDTSGKFSLTERGFEIDASQLIAATTDADSGKLVKLLPFEGEYAMRFAMASPIYLEDSLSLDMIHKVRTQFYESWFDKKANSQKIYPTALFDYHQQLMEKGYFKYYNYWLLLYGNTEEFKVFYEKEETAFADFFIWFNEHGIDRNSGNMGRLSY